MYYFCLEFNQTNEEVIGGGSNNNIKPNKDTGDKSGKILKPGI